MSPPRFKVVSVEGWPVRAGSGGGGLRRPRASFAVLDTHVCHRIVGQFIAEPGGQTGVPLSESQGTDDYRLQAAEKLAARLEQEYR